MKKLSVLLVAGLGCISLFTAVPLSRRDLAQTDSSRKVLYYVDPMNPAHTSDKPGLAPCGMKMELVYAGAASTTAAETRVTAADGSFGISPQRQQLIGLTTAVAEKRSLKRTVRLTGRVVVDETRLYRINASADGWITSAQPFASGMPVKKDDVLATYYSPQLQSAAQSLLYTINVRSRTLKYRQDEGAESPAEATTQALNIQQYTDTLKNLGMEERQIDEIIKQRKRVRDIDIVCPTDGFILSRSITPGQRFERGAEFYRVADLKHVWIIADVLGEDAEKLPPGARVSISQPRVQKRREAIVSSALSSVDPTSRILQLRLEADNQDLFLKPDMLVNVTFEATSAECVAVPADAVLETGSSSVVFVDLGGGRFQSRKVEVGTRAGGELGIVSGLAPGDRVVISGNFLLDSESRMRMAAAPPQEETVDPVCEMTVNKTTAGATAHAGGATWYFCSAHCKERFEKVPAEFLTKSGHAQTPNLARAPGAN